MHACVGKCITEWLCLSECFYVQVNADDIFPQESTISIDGLISFIQFLWFNNKCCCTRN
jgi:hypothetical protein